jgi:hypothetical protein
MFRRYQLPPSSGYNGKLLSFLGHSGSSFFRNVDTYLQTTRRHISEDSNLSSPSREFSSEFIVEKIILSYNSTHSLRQEPMS